MALAAAWTPFEVHTLAGCPPVILQIDAEM